MAIDASAIDPSVRDGIQEAPVVTRRATSDDIERVDRSIERVEDSADSKIERLERRLDTEISGIRGEISGLRGDIQTLTTGMLKSFTRLGLFGLGIPIVALLAMASLVGGIVYVKGYNFEAGSGTTVTKEPNGVVEVHTGPKLSVQPTPAVKDTDIEKP